MDTLPKDILMEIALKTEVSDVLKLCSTKKIFNEKICENYVFWIKKLKEDFNIEYNKIDSKDVYMEVTFEFNNALNIIYFEGYPEKLVNHLLKTGYIDEFKKEISKLLGPEYGKKVDYDEYQMHIYPILEEYFFEGGNNKGYYPLGDVEYDFLKAFKIEDES